MLAKSLTTAIKQHRSLPVQKPKPHPSPPLPSNPKPSALPSRLVLQQTLAFPLPLLVHLVLGSHQPDLLPHQPHLPLLPLDQILVDRPVLSQDDDGFDVLYGRSVGVFGDEVGASDVACEEEGDSCPETSFGRGFCKEEEERGGGGS